MGPLFVFIVRVYDEQVDDLIGIVLFFQLPCRRQFVRDGFGLRGIRHRVICLIFDSKPRIRGPIVEKLRVPAVQRSVLRQIHCRFREVFQTFILSICVFLFRKVPAVIGSARKDRKDNDPAIEFSGVAQGQIRLPLPYDLLGLHGKCRFQTGREGDAPGGKIQIAQKAVYDQERDVMDAPAERRLRAIRFQNSRTILIKHSLFSGLSQIGPGDLRAIGPVGTPEDRHCGRICRKHKAKLRPAEDEFQHSLLRIRFALLQTERYVLPLDPQRIRRPGDPVIGGPRHQRAVFAAALLRHEHADAVLPQVQLVFIRNIKPRRKLFRLLFSGSAARAADHHDRYEDPGNDSFHNAIIPKIFPIWHLYDPANKKPGATPGS